MITKFSPTDIASELKEQAGSDKRKLGFLFGAGSSMAIGIPGIDKLTENISKSIDTKYRDIFSEIRNNINNSNIETVLNQVRTIRELIGDSQTLEYHGIKGKDFAREFDIEICRQISDNVSTTKVTSIEPHLQFANWIRKNHQSRRTPIELFTTNYDLFLEKCLEEKGLPYFDGFVGSVNPFLVPESIECDSPKIDESSYVPYGWIRLWKIHGSVNWCLKNETTGKRITRSFDNTIKTGDELMIYPSRQKYDQSRKLPYIVYQDRLRKFLSSGETFFLIIGYNFGDEHINEILFQALRSNKRLAVTALIFGDIKDEKRITNNTLLDYGKDNPNLTILGPDKASVGGVALDWDTAEPDLDKRIFWLKNNDNNCFNLGDFRALATFL